MHLRTKILRIFAILRMSDDTQDFSRPDAVFTLFLKLRKKIPS